MGLMDARRPIGITFGRPPALEDALSARRRTDSGLAARLRMPLIMIGAGLLLNPALTIDIVHALLVGAFLLLVIWRVVLFNMATLPRLARRNRDLTDPELPRYTVLVPLYREARALPGLIRSLSSLDYPQDQLEIFLLVEADDSETRAALRALTLPPCFFVMLVPPGHPRTKPRALNHGLAMATGDLVVIYDAEDRPHRNQLRAAASAFMRGGERLVCVQAPLRAYNARESWISGQWGLEYLVQFSFLVPALARLGLPVPLGGTSNHFRAVPLHAAGGWDAWNVTEDADLGIRLSRLGYTVGTISEPTLEEAPIGFRAWTAQRSRWIKGYIQTWLTAQKQASDPALCLRPGQAIAIHVILGGTILSATLHGIFAVWFALMLLLPGVQAHWFDVALLAFGIGSNMAIGALACIKTRTPLIGAVLTQPAYWPLMSVAAARAWAGLFMRPHYWAKTEHGITRLALPADQDDMGADQPAGAPQDANLPELDTDDLRRDRVYRPRHLRRATREPTGRSAASANDPVAPGHRGGRVHDPAPLHQHPEPERD